MAENSKSGMLAKTLQKRVVRAKEKVLQNLGKADKTTDDRLGENVNNFNKQQTMATKLQKELKNYITSAKAMGVASKSLFYTISEIYEEDWTRRDNIIQVKNSIDLLWGDYLHKLCNDITTPLNNYIGQFSEVRSKISKRGRKLVDFDSARHNHQSLVNAKKRDDAKLAKAQEELNEAQAIYEQMNNTLHADLPVLYDSRVTMLCANLQALTNAECIFHTEFSKLLHEINEATEILAREHNKTSVAIKNSTLSEPPPECRLNGDTDTTSQGDQLMSNSLDLSAVSNHGDSMDRRSIAKNSDSESQKSLTDQQAQVKVEVKVKVDLGAVSITDSNINEEDKKEPLTEQDDYEIVDRIDEEPPSEPNNDGDDNQKTDSLKLSREDTERQSEIVRDVRDTDTETETETSIYAEPGPDTDVYQVPESNKLISQSESGLINPPADLLYMVESTHPYRGEDNDELSFEAGERIYVVPFDDPDEQDEGWLMGMKERAGDDRQGDGHKGVFPANFTKPV